MHTAVTVPLAGSRSNRRAVFAHNGRGKWRELTLSIVNTRFTSTSFRGDLPEAIKEFAF